MARAVTCSQRGAEHAEFGRDRYVALGKFRLHLLANAIADNVGVAGARFLRTLIDGARVSRPRGDEALRNPRARRRSRRWRARQPVRCAPCGCSRSSARWQLSTSWVCGAAVFRVRSQQSAAARTRRAELRLLFSRRGVR